MKKKQLRLSDTVRGCASESWIPFENNLYIQKDIKMIAGIDEAGRGALAGPVVAAAVVFSRDIRIDGITDSKLIPHKKRLHLLEKIQDKAYSIGIGVASADEIDKINILQATFLAMTRAIDSLYPKCNLEYLLVDGHMNIPSQIPQNSIIQGDRLCFSIAAASIVAKVTRDLLLENAAVQYPLYELEKHKGYGTKKHRELIKQHGPSIFHRKTFRGVKEWLEPSNLSPTNQEINNIDEILSFTTID